jgi:hypothetical protein
LDLKEMRMPRSFRSLLAHADELLADPGEGVARVEVRRASAAKTAGEARLCPAMLNQRLFEWAQEERRNGA